VRDFTHFPSGLAHRSLRLIRARKIGNIRRDWNPTCCTIAVDSAERVRLEVYNLAIRNFYDSLTGLNSVTEEARLRCEKAYLACKEARRTYEGEKVERVPSHSLLPWPEREVIEEQCRTAVIAFGDAVDGIRLPPRIVYGKEREKIERSTQRFQFSLQDVRISQRTHRCRKRAKAGSA
jgi:hypothetical protein